MKSIYLDYNAGTPLAGAALQAMLPYQQELFVPTGNPHWLSRAVEEGIEDARIHVAEAFDCLPTEIIFTSGNTESVNIALLGYAHAQPQSSKSTPHMVLSTLEHEPVSGVAQALQNLGWEISRVPCNEQGIVDLDDFQKAVQKNTRIISLQMANRDIGSLQNIAEASNLRRPKQCIFHCDVSQAIGKIPIAFQELNVDLMTFGGNYVYAPKGVGVVYIRNGVSLNPILFGSWQEMGLRPGSENASAIVGLGAAMQLVKSAGPEIGDRKEALTQLFLREFSEELKAKFTLHGSQEARLPNTLSIELHDHDARSVMQKAPELFVGYGDIDHAVPVDSYPTNSWQAIGLDVERRRSVIRISTGWNTTEEEIHKASYLIANAVN